MSEKRVALVTGASRGIGFSIAKSLERNGFDVIGTATGQNGIDSIEREFRVARGCVTALPLDVAEFSSIDAFLAELEKRELRPLVVINNAGITRDNLLIRMKDEEWTEVITANLGAVFYLCKRLIRPMLKARYGRIINITSVVGVSGNAGQTNYAAAKAGIVGFTKSLADEVANRGITVNAVSPGLIDTDMTRGLTEKQKQRALEGIPLGRMGTPQDIAEVVAFLASDGASYITGETIHVNGGMYMA